MTNKDHGLIALHRYFIWADSMKVHFDDVLSRGRDQVENFQLEAFLYMSYWYASTYVVIEGWKDLKLSDVAVDDLLDSPNVDCLRKYRNGVFHFQKHYFDEARFAPLICEGDNVVEWIRGLRDAFGLFFLREIERMNMCRDK